MPPVPVMSGREVVRIFERLGWTVARQRGSHIILTRDGSMASLSVPDHKEVAPAPPCTVSSSS
ncbi:MAG: addiction module toxin, HicA family [Nitrospiraceae bacterium]|nr:addiction module toxin, HicA family [Nitrospiraceae bacterium]